jgi:hypothetical protein
MLSTARGRVAGRASKLPGSARSSQGGVRTLPDLPTWADPDLPTWAEDKSTRCRGVVCPTEMHSWIGRGA